MSKGECYQRLLDCDAPYFLLSVSKLCDQGFRFSFYDTGGRIVNQDDNVFATMSRVGDLHHLDLIDKHRRSKPLDFSGSTFLERDESHLSLSAVPIQIWHQRYAHINIGLLTWMHRRHIVYGLDVGSLRIHNGCDGCNRGKAINDRKIKNWHFFEKPLSFSEVPAKSLRVCQLDWCGPFRTRGNGGFYYFVLFVDLHSRAYFLYPSKDVRTTTMISTVDTFLSEVNFLD